MEEMMNDEEAWGREHRAWEKRKKDDGMQRAWKQDGKPEVLGVFGNIAGCSPQIIFTLRVKREV